MISTLRENVVEALIGALVIAVAVWFVVFAYGRTSADSRAGYPVLARFPNATGITPGTDIRVSGIKVGVVSQQKLDPKTYQAVVTMRVDDALKLPIDTSAAITSEGILGGSYISLVPGGEPDMLRPGDEITDTQGATDLMGLIGSVINNSGSKDAAPAAAPAAAPQP
jgi:phospholipid/cholesterol/gamma-HCH transport system substrate-binding protein